MRIAPAIALSTLLFSPMFGADWNITRTETKSLNNQTINGVDLTGNGNLTLNSSGNNTISEMLMYWLNDGAGATFNVNNGTLNLDLGIANIHSVPHTVTFDVKNGASLILTRGKNGGEHGNFRGLNTTLKVSLQTGATLDGNLSNNGDTTIQIKQGANLNGGILQDGGNLEATIEGKLDGSISLTRDVQQTNLWANKDTGGPNGGLTSTITGNIIQDGGPLEGILKNLRLQGSFTQTGGRSDIAFWYSKLESNTTLSDAFSTIHFYDTDLQTITTNNGTATINLKAGSTMKSYNGTGSTTNLSLEANSSMQSALQSSGELNIKSSASTINGSITGSNGATLFASISAGSIVTGSISNTDGRSNISVGNSTIQGNIIQNNSNVGVISIIDSTLQGRYSQTGGQINRLEARNSTIDQGIFFTNVQAGFGALNLQLGRTKVNQGIHIRNNVSELIGEITEGSTINGGYFQEGRERMQITFKNSTLNDGIEVRNSEGLQGADTQNSQNYMTTLFFTQGSRFNGGVTSTNHSTWLELSGRSNGEGDLNITRGNFYFKANASTHTGSLNSNDTEQTDFFLDTKSTFNGNITQNNGRQNITLRDFSTLKGSVQNFNTQTKLTIAEDSTLAGSYTQNGGTLNLIMGGESFINGNVMLNEVKTTIGNGQTVIHQETIKGNFTQNGGTLEGRLDGLTLEGKFTQNGGTSNVQFGKADFQQPTLIDRAESSNVIFDRNSKLKDYTINESGKNNSLILDNSTILDGNFTLQNSSSTLKVLNNSKITGSIISEDEDNELDLVIKNGGTVEGDIIISNGKAGGDFDGATIGGDIKLKDANSHFHFKNSTIGGNIDILRGTTMMTLDNTAVRGYFYMREQGPINPTLKLKISNGSSIGEDLWFKNTTAFLGGEGLGNVIKGNLISDDSTLTNGGAKYGGTGNPFPISGLTINGELKQNNGTLDLNFSNQSNIKGKTTLNKGDFSHLTISTKSKLGILEVIEGEDNLITLQDRSSQTGGITLSNTDTTIKVLNQSSITGDITATAQDPMVSKTHLILDNNATFTGNFKQSSGRVTFDFSRNSAMLGDVNIQNLDFEANLDESSMTGTFIANNTTTLIHLNNNSLMNSTIQSTNNKAFVVEADNKSTLQGSITHITANIQPQFFDLALSFDNGSTLQNTKMEIIGNAKIDASDSVINSTEGIVLNFGKLDLFLDHSGGTIQSLTTGGNNVVNITTTNASDSTISGLFMNDNSSLTLFANNQAIIRGTLSLEEASSGTLTAINNAQIRFDILPDAKSTLKVGLNGGMLVGGVLQDAPTAGIINLASANGFGGRWVVTKDSALKELVVSNSSSAIQNLDRMQANTFESSISLVDLTYDSEVNSRIGLDLLPANTPAENLQPTQTLPKNLTLHSLKGLNGVFRVYTDLGSNLSDKITTTLAEGDHTIQVYYNPRTFTHDIQDKYIPVVQVKDPNTSASFEGGETQIGIQTYQTQLVKVNAQDGDGFEWIIGSIQDLGPGYGTKVISSILQSQYRTIFALNQSLNERLGDIRGATRASGLWAKYSMGQSSYKETDSGVATKDDFYSVWAGYDHNTLSLKGHNFAGFALSYTEFTPDNKDYTGNMQSIGFNFYDTFWARNDFYFDLVFQYIFTLSDYNISYASLSKNAPKYTNHKILVGGEIGKVFKLGRQQSNFFFIQPEAQITSGYVIGNDVSFVDHSNTRINARFNSFTPVILRGGIFVGRDLDYFIRGDVRLGASVLYEVNTGGSVDLDDGINTISYKHGSDFKTILEIGTNLILNDVARLHFEALTSFFGNTNINYAINAGVRFSFGYKNTRRLKVPSAMPPPPPPPPPPYDPRNLNTIQDNTRTDIQGNLRSQQRPAYNSDYFINTRKSFRDQTSL